MLNEWMKKNKRTNQWLADQIGASAAHVSYLRNCKRKPSPGMAQAIEYATNGEITRLQLLYPKNDAA